MFTDVDLRLTDEHRLLQETVRRFAREKVRPAGLFAHNAASIEDIVAPGSLWREARIEGRRLGFHVASLPEAVGGLGLDPLGLHILLEELGWGSPGFALALTADSAIAAATLMHQPDNARLCEDLVAPFIADSDCHMVGCVAISEPDHGSDALWTFTRESDDPKLAFATRAQRDGDGWVISGQKSAWVSNGVVATHALLWLSVCDAGGRVAGGGIAVVPLDLSGVSRGAPTDLLGSRDFPQCPLFFDEARIPGDYLIVGPERYAAAMDGFLNMGGLVVGVAYLGLARAAFEEAMAYAQTRVQGGRPIVEHQATRLALYDMFTKIEAARALSRQAMIYCMQPHETAPIAHSTAVKFYCTEIAFEVAHEAVRIFGAAGLVADSPIAKMFCDARAGVIGDGCNRALSLKRSRNLIDAYRN